MKESRHYKTLVERYVKGEISKEELEAFVHLTRAGLLDKQLLTAMDNELQDQFHAPLKKSSNQFKSFLWVAAAAIVLLVIAFFFVPDSGTRQMLKTDAAAIQPGSNRAILTLASGKQIVLDSTTQNLNQLTNIDPIKSTNENLVYKKAAAQSKNLIYNTISVPEGGQFHLVLPDGSNVWLNAASTLIFPIAFNDHERRVKLTGEGYFEITPDSKRPFSVETEKQLVNVLGTNFNIAAYPTNDLIKTSLLSGKVEIVSEKNQPVILSPGKQLALNKQTYETKTKSFDTEEIIAWKNGNFLFNETPLADILMAISRWYAVKVNLKDTPPIQYNGFISRNVSLLKVLDMLEKTGDVKFKFENNTIKITNQSKKPM